MGGTVSHQRHDGADGGDEDDGDCWVLADDAPDYPPDECVDETTASSDMICAITLSVMVDPAMVKPCGHSYETEHLQDYLIAYKTCPRCRRLVTRSCPNPDLKRRIREAVITRCPIAGCEVQMKIKELRHHIKHECNFARFRCMQADAEGRFCGKVVTRTVRSWHAMADCPHRKVPCEYCGMEVFANQLGQHLCAEGRTPCPVCLDLVHCRRMEEHDADPSMMARHERVLLDALPSDFQTCTRHLLDGLSHGTSSPCRLLTLLKVLVGRMRRHGESGHAATLGSALKALSRLVAVNSDASARARAQLMGMGAAEAVVGAMTVSDDHDVSLWGCAVVGDLAYKSAQAKVAWVKAGAVERVVAAMDTFPLDKPLQHLGCYALQALAAPAAGDQGDGKGLEALLAGVMRKAEAGARVMGAMQAFRKDREVQCCACAVLCFLAQDESHRGRRRLVVEGAAKAVAQARDAFPNDKSVQYYATGAMQGLLDTLLPFSLF